MPKAVDNSSGAPYGKTTRTPIPNTIDRLDPNDNRRTDTSNRLGDQRSFRDVAIAHPVGRRRSASAHRIAIPNATSGGGTVHAERHVVVCRNLMPRGLLARNESALDGDYYSCFPSIIG